MKSFIPKPTKFANKLYDLLVKRFGISVQKEVFDGYKHIDLSIDSAKLDIEVDGMQHLTNPEQIVRDLKRSNYSREDGYETLHIHNIDLDKDASAIALAVAEVVKLREKDIDSMGNIPPEFPIAKIG